MPTPSGTVTFLFTDIEGSTRFIEQDAESARECMVRHDAVLAEVIARHGGQTFKTVGDAFCVAFGSARDALLTALEAARELRGACPLRVRMALHTGTVEPRGGDFFGLQLSRVSRLLSAGHGGQVLLSSAAAEVVRDDLPEGVTLLNLGLHRLKDLQRPEQIYQLAHPDIERDFPPLRTLDHLPNNLPHQLTSFVGREREMESLQRELEEAALLTLTGPGGCGKSRLSLQVAAQALDDFPGGVWLVELAPLDDPEGVPAAVAKALHVREEAGRAIEETLALHLGMRPTLLVLDNCEHLLAACAELASRLLRACPTVRILATSQESLGVAGEAVRLVPPLGRPDGDDLPCVAASEAARLFVARASAANAEFRLDEETAPAVADVCRRLDGVPLALELAAAMMGAMTAQELAARLDSHERFRVLTQGDPTSLPKHRSLESMIGWSHDLLLDRDAGLFRRLAVFRGGWTLDAAEEVCDDPSVLPDLARLVKKSLVVAENRRGGTRYRFLETIRHYALDRLRESGDGPRLRARHRDHFVGLAQRAEAGLLGPGLVPWLDRLDADLDNLRAALDACLEDEEGTEPALRLVGPLWRFWQLRGDLREGLDWYRAALARRGGPTAARAKAHNGAGALAINLDEYDVARGHYEAALEIYRARADGAGTAQATFGLARVATALGDYAKARELYAEVIAKRRLLGDDQGLGSALNNLGLIALELGELDEAERLLREDHRIESQLGNGAGVANALCNLANLALARGNARCADEHARLALALAGEVGNRLGIAEARRFLAEARRRLGDLDEAQDLTEGSLATYIAAGDRRNAAEVFEQAAALLRDRGEPRRAALLLGAAEGLRTAVGRAATPHAEVGLKRLRAELATTLGATAWETIRAEGRIFSPQEAYVRVFGEPS